MMIELYWSTGTDARALAHCLLRHAWSQHHTAPLPPVKATPLGKPYIEVDSFHFSISHTASLAVCAISHTPIGVDAEKIRPLSKGIEHKILCPNELALYFSCPPQEHSLLDFWTKKEAATKYIGTGLQGRPKDTDTTTFSRKRQLHFHTLTLDGCLLNVCSPQEIAPRVYYVPLSCE